MSDQPDRMKDYRVFTRRFDKIVLARDLRLSPSAKSAWEALMERTARERVGWELKALEHAVRVREAASHSARQDTIVTLLIDHSGSMRGGRMLLTAAAVEVALPFLMRLDVKVEVLGFTTRSWKGGWSRRLWRWTGRKPAPGRLCDLLHIVYKSAEGGPAKRFPAHLLDLNLLKENVDGEALLWAASRQDCRSESSKVIVAISDGAPVDDSTLVSNDPNILWNHFNDVVATLEQTRTMAQLQIGDETPSPFRHVTRVDTLQELGDRLLELLAGVIIRTCEDRANVQSEP